MSDYFLGEVRMFAFAWAPRGWALCNGAILNVNQNAALYSLLVNQYGGTAPTTFALPDLRGRAILGQGVSLSGQPSYYTCGAQIGSETVTLGLTQVPLHNHTMVASNDTANGNTPATNFLAKPVVSPTTPTPILLYAQPSAGTPVALDPGTVTPAPAASGHANMQPFLVTNYCIALSGDYPMRN